MLHSEVDRRQLAEEWTIIKKRFVTYIGVLTIITVSLAIVFSSIHNNSPEPIRVACIGNSITEYSGYPDMLQTMLGSGYVVGNFGVSASTVIFNSQTPYFHQTEFTEAKEFLPDIAVIMLGTNDARTDHFNSIDNFTADYMEIINAFQELESSPEIVLVKPPPLFENVYDLQTENLVDGIIPRIEQTANDMDLPVVDVYSVLESYPQYFPDGVHPNSEGAQVIAEKVYEAITG